MTLSIDNVGATTKLGYFTDVNGIVGVSTKAMCTAGSDNGIGGAVAGRGGFFNVPPGPETITAKLVTGETVATFHVFVRAGAISLVELPPTM